jgi:hypothetical protein
VDVYRLMVMNANVVASVVNKISTGGSDDRATDGVYGNRTLGDEFLVREV